MLKLKLKFTQYEKILVIVFFVFYACFCNYLMSETPHLTWFNFLHLAEKWYSQDIKISDLFSNYGEHGMLGYNILFLINVIVFKMSVFFDIYINDIVVLFIALMSIYCVKQLSTENKSAFYRLAIVIIALFNFTPMQLTSGAMETQVRIGLGMFFLLAIMSSRCLSEDVSFRYLVATIMVMVISINVFGSMYTFAGIGAILLLIFILFICKRKLEKKALILLSAILLCTLLYILQYNILSKGAIGEGGLTSGIFDIFLHPLTTIKSFAAYNGSAVLGYATWADGRLPDWIYLLVGALVSLIYLISIVLYFHSGMYKKTYVPPLLMGYSFAVFPMVAISRSLEWQWFVNPWYQVHTKIAAVACVWILLYSFQHRTPKSEEKMLRWLREKIRPILPIFCRVGTVLLGLLVLYGSTMELLRAPHAKAYYENMQQYLFYTREQMPVDENGNTPLIASLDKTMEAINIMKKYELSLFRYYYLFEQAQAAPLWGQSQGQYEDNWLSPQFIITQKSGPHGRIIISGFYPGDITGNETGQVVINGKAYDFIIEENKFNWEYEVEPNALVSIEISSDFLYDSSETGDMRELCFLLLDIILE